MNIITHKLCSKCKVDKEISLFSKQKDKKDGLRANCNSCLREYRQNNAVLIAEKKKKYYDKNVSSILEHKKEYYQANSESIAIYQKSYRLKNPEKIANDMKQYNILNKDNISINKKEYRLSNIKHISDYQKVYRKENVLQNAVRSKAYRQTQKGKAIEKNKYNKRRTLTKQGDVTTQQMIELQKGVTVCYWCNCSLNKKVVHIDHYIPLSKGGEHTLSNLVISCAWCNLSKHSKDPIAFANSIGKLL